MVAVAVDHRPDLQRERRARALPPQAARSRHRATVARRYRAAGVCAVALAACAVWVQAGATDRPGSGPLAAPGAGPTRAVAARMWVVQPGETVWGIAHALQPTGDVRPLVDTLASQLHGRPLQIGQRLLLP